MAEKLPFQENWFDLVVSVGVMEHRSLTLMKLQQAQF
jgi:cyclopropane fatty-acyl-phospholipid synthase-like methyltransferase